MTGVSAMIKAAEADLGTGEPNHIQKWYNREVANLGSSNWAWCDAAISYWASKSGNFKAVCPKGGRAYTVYHARDFQKLGQWHRGDKDGVSKCKPGDIVFFDWGKTDSIGAIDHVGIVTKSHGNGTVETIEGNTSNKCLRKTRSYVDIAGYGRPKYPSGGSEMPSNGSSRPADGVASDGTIYPGAEGSAVKTLQTNLNKLGASPKLVVDGEYGPATRKAVDAYKGKKGLTKDGVVGDKMRAAMKADLAPKPAPKPPKPAPVTLAAVMDEIKALRVEVRAILKKVG